MQAATQLSPPISSSSRGATPAKAERKGHWQSHIQGRIRPITTHQLIMAWWLHNDGHLTRRQLRCYFALHEMHGRRLAPKEQGSRGQGRERPRKPFYGVEELRTLIGGATSDKALRADLARLAATGLVSMTERSIDFATSIEQISLPHTQCVNAPAAGTDAAGEAEPGSDADPHAGFWAMLMQIRKANRRRTIPVPRRTLRALAGGFSRGTTAVMLAMLIHCLFRHAGSGNGEGEGEGGRYRIDGRTKGSWIADTFGISRRAVTEGRTRLIELGWMTPLDVDQIMLNKWGTHDLLNPDWSAETEDPTRLPEIGEADTAADPHITANRHPNLLAQKPESAPKSASPNKENQNTSYENLNQNTRPCPPAPASSGVSAKRIQEKSRGAAPTTKQTPPRWSNLTRQDLADNERLIELHAQSVSAGRWGGAEADRLDWFALAERARAEADNPPAMFRWLIEQRKTKHIAQIDEDNAARRLRELRNGPVCREVLPHFPPAELEPPAMSETDRKVEACLRVAKKRRMEPFYVARSLWPDWTLTQWESALWNYEQACRSQVNQEVPR